MKRKLIIDGNAVYEIDEDCMVRQCLREADASIEKKDNNFREERQRQINDRSNCIDK